MFSFKTFFWGIKEYQKPETRTRGYPTERERERDSLFLQAQAC